MAKPLPMIPRNRVDKHGMVELWDMLETDGEGNVIGPVKIKRQAILAREALQRDPDRYRLDLPRGVKPGPAQEEAERRAAEEAAEAEAEAAADPVYGAARRQA